LSNHILSSVGVALSAVDEFDVERFRRILQVIIRRIQGVLRTPGASDVCQLIH